MKPPDPPPQITPTDPRLDAERAAADAANLKAMMAEAQGDTASLMARYGTRLAFAGGSPLGSPLTGLGGGANMGGGSPASAAFSAARGA
jgi:hypothetical protein